VFAASSKHYLIRPWSWPRGLTKPLQGSRLGGSQHKAFRSPTNFCLEPTDLVPKIAKHLREIFGCNPVRPASNIDHGRMRQAPVPHRECRWGGLRRRLGRYPSLDRLVQRSGRLLPESGDQPGVVQSYPFAPEVAHLEHFSERCDEWRGQREARSARTGHAV
jgi:hypothetical protein